MGGSREGDMAVVSDVLAAPRYSSKHVHVTLQGDTG